MEDSVSNIVSKLLEQPETSKLQLSQRLGVSPTTLSRWLAGNVQPAPEKEGKLRAMYEEARASTTDSGSNQRHLDFQAPDDALLKKELHQILNAVRETLHRSGRLSSRHEALDEVSKLLFAHVVSIDTGGAGISRSLLKSGSSPAAALRDFVSSTIQNALPSSLAYELNIEDFDLRIKRTEDRFAAEIIHCFDASPASEQIRYFQGAGAADLLNDIFGRFLADSFSDEKELGQYLTPTEVVDYMVEIAIGAMSPRDVAALCSPEAGLDSGVVLDPSCGVGSFLARAASALYKIVRDRHGVAATSEWTQNFFSTNLVGLDKSERMIKLAITNLAMFGVPHANLHLINALARHGLDAKVTDDLEGRAKLILTNPPFGAEFSGDDLSKYKLATTWAQRFPTKVDSELLFLERYSDWLSPGGVLAAIVPDSILTNRGLFADLRSGLRPSIDLLSVTSLPAVAFAAAGTTTKTSVLLLKKRATNRTKSWRTYFATCSSIGFDVTARGSIRRKVSNDQNDLLSARDNFLRRESAADFGEHVDLKFDSARWDAQYHIGLPKDVKARLDDQRRPGVKISDCCYLSQDRVDPRRSGAATFFYVEISDVMADGSVGAKLVARDEAPSRARKLIRAGDVLVSTVRPERRAVGVVPHELDGAVCSTGFAVLRPTAIDSLTLVRALQSDFANAQILRNNVGIAYPAIDESCLLEVVLPLERKNLAQMTSIAEEVHAAGQLFKQAHTRFRHCLDDAIGSWMQTPSTPETKPHLS